MAGSTTKTVQDRIVSLDFQRMIRPRYFPLPHENASGRTSPRTKPDLCQHKAGLPLPGSNTYKYAIPGRYRPLSQDSPTNSNNHTVKYLGSIPWYHFYPDGNRHTLGARPLKSLPQHSCFDHFWVVRLDEVSSTKLRFSQSHALINKWSAALRMPHYQIGNVSLVTINYITFELVRLREGC